MKEEEKDKKDEERSGSGTEDDGMFKKRLNC